jgi:hypothetical protein
MKFYILKLILYDFLLQTTPKLIKKHPDTESFTPQLFTLRDSNPVPHYPNFIAKDGLATYKHCNKSNTNYLSK